MTLLAKLHDRHRAAERQELGRSATIRRDGFPLDAVVLNLSASGCLFFCSEPLGVGDTMSIGIAGVGRRRVRIVRADQSRYGGEFEAPLTPLEMDVAVSVLGTVVVSLPPPGEAASVRVEASASGGKLFRPVSFIIVSGFALTCWFAMIAVAHAIR